VSNVKWGQFGFKLVSGNFVAFIGTLIIKKVNLDGKMITSEEFIGLSGEVRGNYCVCANVW